MKAKSSLKLYNATNQHKDNLVASKVFLYSPLLDLSSWQLSPTLAQFPSLLSLRAYLVADWLRRVLEQRGDSFELVSTTAQSNVSLVESNSQRIKGQFVLEVAPFVTESKAALPTPTSQSFALDVLRYYVMSSSYRSPLQWSLAALAASQAALERLREYASRCEAENLQTNKKDKSADQTQTNVSLKEWRERFYGSLYDDLNMSRALAVIWTLLQSTLSPTEKLHLLREFDRLLGLGLTSYYTQDNLVKPKSQAASVTPSKKAAPNLKIKPKPEPLTTSKTLPLNHRIITSTRDVRSLLDEPDKFDFTVSIIAYYNLTATRQTIESVLFYSMHSKQQVELVVADLGGDEELTRYLEGQVARYANFRVIYGNPDRFLGEAAGRNLALRQGRGKYLLLLDAGLILKADIFELLFATLQELNTPGLYGLYPLEMERRDNRITGSKPLMLNPDAQPPKNVLEVEALEGAFLCFQRNLVDEVGFLDERFRYPFALDLDYSFAFRDKGLKVFTLPTLTDLVQRPHLAQGRPDYDLPAGDLEHQAHKNWQLFLKSWSLQ